MALDQAEAQEGMGAVPYIAHLGCCNSGVAGIVTQILPWCWMGKQLQQFQTAELWEMRLPQHELLKLKETSEKSTLTSVWGRSHLLESTLRNASHLAERAQSSGFLMDQMQRCTDAVSPGLPLHLATSFQSN